MAADRNGRSLSVGDAVRTTKAMGVGGTRAGVVQYIDGEYIGVAMKRGGSAFVAERYGCELEKAR